MKKQSIRILSIAMSMFIVISMIPVNVLAKATVENSPYHSVASIGDSISAGYGPLMGNNTWSNYYYGKPPAGAYPRLLTEDLELDIQKDFNSLLCVDQRLVDVYYAIGGDVAPVLNPDSITVNEDGSVSENPDVPATLDYLEDARLYHSEPYMAVLEDLHNSGEGAERIKNSELITILIGMADLTVYPIKRTRLSSGDHNTEKIAKMMEQGTKQYLEYYPRLLARIKEINPNAKLCLISQYNPYEKFVATGENDEKLFKVFEAGIKAFNALLWTQAMLSKSAYVDITGLGAYIDNETTITQEGELLEAMISHENHPGAAGHQYVEDQILKALKLKRGSETPSVDAGNAYLAFTSDPHVTDSADSAARLDSWLDNVSDKLGDITFDSVDFCGDLGSASLSGTAYGNKVQYLMNTVDKNTNVKRGIYTTGNHEYNPGKYATQSQYEPYASITRLGEAANTDKYQIFCFGAAQYDQRFNDDDIAALSEYLKNADKNKPVFVLSHFPIHKYASRTSGNASKLVEVLNKYPNVIFLWGHNHTESDTHYGKVYTEELDGTPINFIYCSAGCMSDADYSSGSGNTKAKGLVAVMDGDSDLKLTYYDKNYDVVTSYLVNILSGTAEQLYPVLEPLAPNFDGKIYKSASALAKGNYVIAVGDVAMTSKPHDGYVTVNNNITYTYTGLQGGEIRVASSKVTQGLTADEVWTVKPVSGGFTLQNNDGLYLTGTYTKNAGASIQLEETAGSNGVWTYTSNNHIKHTATGKYLNYEQEADVDGVKQSGETDVFTLRSDANDSIQLYTTAATVQEVLSDYAAADGFVDGAWYVITAEKKALIGTANEGYTNKNGSNKYSYSGLNGKTVGITNGYITSVVGSDMLWQAEKIDGGYALKNKEGKYLNASYTNNTNGFAGVGVLSVSESAEAWILSGGSLMSANCGKYLNYQTSRDIDGTKLTGGANFFTVRSSSKDTVTVFRAANANGESANTDEVVDVKFKKATGSSYHTYKLFTSGSIADGAKVIFAYKNFYMGNTANSGYKNIDNSSKYYNYSGLEAKAIGTTSVSASVTELPIAYDEVDSSIVFTAKKVDGGYQFVSSNGKYLSASYAAGDIEVTENGEAKTVAATGIGTVKLLDEADESCVWTCSVSSSTITLKNAASGKILTYNGGSDVTGTCLDPADKNDVSVFTVRSSRTHSVYLYVDTKVENSAIESGKQYVMVSEDGFGVISETGTGYNDSNSNYRYEGLKPAAVSVEDDVITSLVTKKMVWTITEAEGGYYIQSNEGLYLNSVYNSADVINVYLSENPEVWTLNDGKLTGKASGKQLSHQTNGGTANVFTLRSSGQRFSFYYPQNAGSSTALYTSTIGGGVSTAREVIKGDEAFQGSTAIANEGYTFVGWYKGDELLTEDVTYVPTKAGTYEARFTEITVSIKYEIKLKDNGDASALSLTASKEEIGIVTGTAKGSSANEAAGYTFLYWTSDAEGTKVISKNSQYTPKKVGGVYTDTTYYAWYEKEKICFADETVVLNAPANGTYNLVINGTDCGKFVFTQNTEGWTIYSAAKKKYVSINSKNAIEYSNLAYTWKFDNRGFSTLGKVNVIIVKIPVRYYIVSSRGSIATSSKSPSSTAFTTVANIGKSEHTTGKVTQITDTTHTAICARCGEKLAPEKHSYTIKDDGNGNHTKSCACGKKVTEKHNLAYTIVSDEQHRVCCDVCGMDKIEKHALTYEKTADTHKASCQKCGYMSETTAHSYKVTDNNNGTHTISCECGDKTTESCTYDEKFECTVCKHFDTSKGYVDSVSVTVKKTSKGIGSKKVYTYTATIKAHAVTTTVSKVEYSFDGTSYITGSRCTSSTAINSLWVRVTDANGIVSNWYYDGSTVSKK